MPECCDGCVYLQPAAGLAPKEAPRACRRHAPAPDPLLFGSRWPLVAPGDWCGDFQEKSRVEVCRQCGAPLLAHEIRASAKAATGEHDRSGSSLCDRCWALQAAQLRGPAGQEGPPGLEAGAAAPEGAVPLKAGAPLPPISAELLKESTLQACANTVSEQFKARVCPRCAALLDPEITITLPKLPVDEQAPWKQVIDWFALRFGPNSDPERTPQGHVLRWALELRQEARGAFARAYNNLNPKGPKP